MRLLVTGGAGFIGSNFVRRLCSGIYGSITKVVVLDKLSYAGNLSNLKSIENSSKFMFVKGDIRDKNLVSELLTETDILVNFAAESHVDRSILSSEEFVHTNFNGVQVLLDSVKLVNREIRFIQVSTDEVYGTINSGSWDEEFPLLPNSPYSATKASADLLLRSYNKTHNLDILITRCSNNYGPFQNREKLIPLFITNLILGKKVSIYGDGSNIRDWLHVDDHCDAIFKVGISGKSGEIYNIGGGKELSNLEITKLILKKMNEDESRIRFVKDRNGHDFRYSLNWSKIKNELNFEPKVDFETGLDETIQWYKDNQHWWNPFR